MPDPHNPYKYDVVWPHQTIWQASMVATEDRRWEERHIIDWSAWTNVYGKKQAVMVLDDGTCYVIHEEGTIL